MTTSAPPVAVLDLSRIAQDLQIRKVHVEAVVNLLDQGNTVPFITRYRKEQTGGLNEEVIRRIQHRVGQLRQLAERKATILKSIEAQGKLTPELRDAIQAADSPKRLEDLYLPFKPKKRSLATEAREKGLEPLATAIWTRDPVANNLDELLQGMVNPEKGLNSPEEVMAGVRNILAETISELADLRGAVRHLIWDTALITSTRAEGLPENKGQEYKGYFEFKESVQTIPPHRILAINRGEKEGALKIKLAYDPDRVRMAAIAAVPMADHPHRELLTEVVGEALNRLVLPSIEREVRRELTDFALEHAVNIFARNLRSLLLQPPLRGKRILGIDPGLRTGCKLAALDEHGNLLEHEVIFPHTLNRRDEAFRRAEARMKLEQMIRRHNLSVIAIGNGTACRETEKLVAEVIADLESRQFSGAPKIELPPPEPATDKPAADFTVASVTVGAPVVDVLGPLSSPSATEMAMPATNIMPAEESGIVQDQEPAPVTPSVEAPPPETITGNSPPIIIEPPQFTATTEEPAPPPAVDAPPTPPEPSPSPMETLPLDAMEDTLSAGDASTEAEPEFTAPEAEEPVSPEATPPAPEAAVTVAESSEGAPQAEAAPATTEGTTAPAAEAPAAEAEKAPARPPRPPRPQPELPKIDFESLPAAPNDLAYVIVNEAGASDYSASDIAREEFPQYDATVRSTISIGRRLQDPLAELVKIDPQHVGVGLYQHDVKAKHLRETLEAVIESCVNHVGVDLNTASVPLLRHVSGLNALVARELVEYRKNHGAFKSREQLLSVTGLGPQRYTQAAGFLKLPGGDEPLDETWIHPESYPIARKILEDIGMTSADLRDKAKLEELREKIRKVHPEVYAEKFNAGVPTVKDIFEALIKPSRDPREDLPPPVFRRNVLKIEDLTPGMELKGTVLNVVDFGAFVDIGLKDSGLVHISQLANRYIKNPYEVVSVGDVVTVWVRSVDMSRRHVSLTMIPPGAERRAPQRGAPPREQQQQREPRREGPPREPRREGPPRERAGGPPRDHGQRGRGRGRAPFRRDQQGAPNQQGASAKEAQSTASHSAPPPRRPDPRPKPLPKLTKEAASGKAPLFSFGELAAFFKAKEEPAQSSPPEATQQETPAPESSPPPPAE